MTPTPEPLAFAIVGAVVIVGVGIVGSEIYNAYQRGKGRQR